MIEKDQVITLLEIHGKSVSSTDEEIRTILLSAQYDANEVETALISLRTDPATAEEHNIKKQGLHKIFFTDQTLRPHEVSALLGIDVQIDNITTERVKAEQQRGSVFINILFIILSILFAGSLLLYGMYANNLGPFADTSVFNFY